jgi:hypothetical protein
MTTDILPDESVSQLNPPQTSPPKPDKKRSALCWNFFYPPEGVPTHLQCYVCKCLIKYNSKSSTNLTEHCKKSHQSLYQSFVDAKEGSSITASTCQPQQKLLGFPKAHRFDKEVTTRRLTEWIIMDTQAFVVAENPSFIRFIASLNPDFKLLKGDAIKDRVLAMYRECKESMKQVLNRHTGKFSFTTDIWTSPSSVAFLCVTAHFIDSDWKLVSYILAFRHIPGEHTGVRISALFQEILAEFSLTNRVLCVTLDNASNNDTFISDLVEKGCLYDNQCQIRCFAHVLNLAAKDSLGEFSDKIGPLRSAVKATRYSTKKLERLELLCSQESPPVTFVKPVLDVPTRWSSTFDMLERALQLRVPLCKLFLEMNAQPSELDDGPPPFFSPAEWTTYEYLCEYLEPFKDITVECSGQNHVSFTTVLPLYNVLLDHCISTRKRFSSYIDDIDGKKAGYKNLPSRELCVDLVNAANLSNEKLSGYYQIQSDLAICATVLDPRLNVSFYEREDRTAEENKEYFIPVVITLGKWDLL